MEADGSDKAVKNQRIAQDNNVRMHNHLSAKPNRIQDMFCSHLAGRTQSHLGLSRQKHDDALQNKHYIAS